SPQAKTESSQPKQQRVLSVSGVVDATQTGDLMSEEEFSRLTQDVGMTVPATAMPQGGVLDDDMFLGDMADDQSEVLLLDHEITDEEIVDLVAEVEPEEPVEAQ